MRQKITFQELAEFLGLEDLDNVSGVYLYDGTGQLTVEEFILDENGTRVKNHRHEQIHKRTEIAMVR